MYKSCRACFMFYCMFYFTCDRSLRSLVVSIIVALCSIEVQAYSGHSTEPNYGFVKLNGVAVWQASWGGSSPSIRGVSTVLIDPFSCSMQDSQIYDTHASADEATELATYLEMLEHGSVIAVVTGDEPRNNLANALPTLQQIRADVSDVQNGGAFGFIAQKGFPDKTVLRKTLTREESHTEQPRSEVLITGRL